MKLSLTHITAALSTLVPSLAYASTAIPEPEAASTATPSKPGVSRALAFTVDPISAVRDSRYGVKAELMLAPHHAFLAHPTAAFSSSKTGDTVSSFSNYSVEVGYRYYVEKHGLDGLFLGPSLRYGESHHNNTQTSVGGVADRHTAQAAMAVDMGWKHSTPSGFTYGGGVGVQYVSTAAGMSFPGLAGAALPETRFTSLSPRVLCELGYVFDLH